MGDIEVVAEGARAPDFSATMVRHDGEAGTVTLSSLLADGPLLLTFYTNDFSPDCIREWCSFRDYGWFASDDRVRVVGVSRSKPSTHRRFIDYLDLPFPLISDPGLAIAEAYGVKYRTFKLFPRSRRSCFLLDRDRVVRYTWLAEHPLDPTRDTPDVREIHEAVTREFGPPGGEGGATPPEE